MNPLFFSFDFFSLHISNLKSIKNNLLKVYSETKKDILNNHSKIVNSETFEHSLVMGKKYTRDIGAIKGLKSHTSYLSQFANNHNYNKQLFEMYFINNNDLKKIDYLKKNIEVFNISNVPQYSAQQEATLINHVFELQQKKAIFDEWRNTLLSASNGLNFLTNLKRYISDIDKQIKVNCQIYDLMLKGKITQSTFKDYLTLLEKSTYYMIMLKNKKSTITSADLRAQLKEYLQLKNVYA